jgi:hypothetical protein
MDREKTYWNSNGTYQKLSEQLENMIPSMGEVENPKQNPKLERLRKLTNAYYDLYNNGGCNPCRGTAKYFRGTITMARDRKWEDCYAVTEPIMDKAILKAAKEQGLI